MTFYTNVDQADIRQSTYPDFELSQHGRAALEMLGSIQKFSSSVIRNDAMAKFSDDSEGKKLSEEHVSADTGDGVMDRIEAAKKVAESINTFRLERFTQRYVAEQVFVRSIPAVEDRREEFEKFLAVSTDSNSVRLELDETIGKPDYFEGVNWHLQPGGYDGMDLYGALFAYAIGPKVFRHGGYAANEVGDDIVQQRINAARELPKKVYGRIFEFACGGVTTLSALHKVFPDAELVGCDISTVLLKTGHAIACKTSLPVTLKQRYAENTGEEDNSFDAVVLYSFMHEAPPEVGREILREAKRILKPGGDLLISDPPPFKEVSIFQAVVLDWDTVNREEPYFSDVLQIDWSSELEKLGFTGARSFSMGERGYPWISIATKPPGTSQDQDTAA